MKYPLEQYKQLKSVLGELIKYLGIDKKTALDNCNYLHYLVHSQSKYDSSHPNVFKDKNNQRIFAEIPDFKLYPEGCNDSHVETAMKKAINEIFNK